MIPHCPEWYKLGLRSRIPTPTVRYLVSKPNKTSTQLKIAGRPSPLTASAFNGVRWFGGQRLGHWTDVRLRGCRFNSGSDCYQVTTCGQVNHLGIQPTITQVNSAFHPSRLANQVSACMAKVKVGCVHLCRAVLGGNTAWFYMASDVR